MNKATVNAEECPLPSWSGDMCRFAVKVMEELKCENWELSILLCGDKTITQLNAQYRNKNEPTDILSFNLGETVQEDDKSVYLPGDIVISLDTLRENAKYYNISEDEELRRLIIHGILHLNGMNHETNEQSEPMLILQEEILRKLENKRIISLKSENGGER